MEENQSPYEMLVLVCTNSRPQGQKVSCAGEGRSGEKIAAKIKEFLEREGLKGKIRVTKTGCLNQCEKGPNVVIMPHNIWLSGVDPENIEPDLAKYFKV
ncbi:MAG: (2Fe-2S) ferredoxin domain-containing protein [Elusimicrobia bacterium]|nr:(2Fe-2S) ferredoxin domain-containing protein [Candidatus Obscuribacterium magneticum]